MRVGLCYDLRESYLAMGYSEEDVLEFDKISTVEGLEGALAALGHEPVRIGNYRDLIHALETGERWDLVFNIAEGLFGLGRESLVPALLDAWRIPYTFSDPMVLGLCLHKEMCKRVVRQLGVPTADFALVSRLEDLAKVDLPYPLFAKPVAEGTGKGVSERSKVDSPEQLRDTALELLSRFQQPVLVETFLPGREFTVGIVGTGVAARVVGVMEVLMAKQDAIYSGEVKENYVGVVQYALLSEPALKSAVEQTALAAWRGLGCRDGGRLDIRLDAHGTPCFVEVNPLAGLNHIHSDLPIMVYLGGGTYDELIRDILNSAMERCTCA